MDREFEEFLASQAYAENTKDHYRRVFERVLMGRELRKLGAAELVKMIKSMGWGNSQECVAVAASRKYLRWRFGEKHPALGAKIKSQPSKLQRTLTVELALELLMSFDETPKGRRDLALAATLLDTGLRASEICRLKLADVDLDHGVCQVIIKGGQWGVGVISEITVGYIREWLQVRTVAVGVGSLFTNIQHGTQLTREGLQCIMKVWGKRVGILLSPHDFRRSYACIASVFGAPSRLVQIGGRWSSIDMVEHYTRAIKADAMRPYLPVSRLLNRTA